MSKHIASIPLADIERIAIVTGNGRSMAQVKGDADYICNAGFYDMTTGRPVGHLKADGAVLAKEAWGCWGFAWDKSDIKMSALPDEFQSTRPLRGATAKVYKLLCTFLR